MNPTMGDVNHPTAIIEDLSHKYKALIEAERNKFMEAENQYNSFIEKMDEIHRELELKCEGHIKANENLTYEN